MRQRIVVASALAGTALLGAAGGIGVWQAVAQDDSAPAVAVERSSASKVANPQTLTAGEVYRRAAPGVVEVAATRQTEGGFGGPQQATAGGSGFIIDEQGHVITNEHVVDGATSVTVRFASGDEASARVVGSDPSTDIALLDIEDSRDVTPLELGSSKSLSVGDPVVAIGSPFGLDGTLTSGIVSALGREISAPDGFSIAGVIQTDAALNHGNSGGPLLDSEGRVVGVTSQIESENGGNVGIGYAVPIETAKRVVDQLLRGREVQHAYLGVRLADDDSAGGARISEVVSGGPADDAGVRAGDVVTSLGGTNVDSASQLRAAVEAKQPGDTVSLELRRGGKTRTVDVKLGTRP
jgi:putative serine protease PepD